VFIDQEIIVCEYNEPRVQLIDIQLVRGQALTIIGTVGPAG
jgi:hypothetical protein